LDGITTWNDCSLRPHVSSSQLLTPLEVLDIVSQPE
jgi:hypothetical protein